MERPMADSCVANYGVSFIDLLGQQDALRGPGVLHAGNSEADRSLLIE